MAGYQARGEPLDDWLASQTRLRGITEAATFVTALDIDEYRTAVAQIYRHRCPDRQALLHQLLTSLSS